MKGFPDTIPSLFILVGARIDDGRTWRGPDGPESVYMIDEPAGYSISGSEHGYGWHLMAPGLIMSNGEYILPINISSDPKPLSKIYSEVIFMVSRNIFTEEDPSKVKFDFYPKPPHGILSPMHDNPERTLAQEPQIVELSGGELMCVFRTGNGRVEHSVSKDFGRTWSESAPLRYYPQQGPVIRNPNCAVPFTKLSGGRYALLHTDNDGYLEGSESLFDARRNRHPIYITIGKYIDTQTGQPLIFSASRLLCSIEGFHLENPRRDLTYGALIESEGEYFHFYNALWNYIQVNKVNPALLEFR